MRAALRRALEELDADDRVRAIILTAPVTARSALARISPRRSNSTPATPA